jgi:type IV pilus assembly protein PilV
VVLSTLVIGASGLLLQSQRLARHSAQLSHAALLAGELADRIRLRRSVAPTSTVDGKADHVLDIAIDEGTGSTPAATARDCQGAACSSAEMDAFELADWKRRVSAVLARPRAVVCRDSRPWSEQERRYAWECSPGTKQDGPLVLKLGWQSPFGEKAAVFPLLVVPVE